MVTGPLLKAKVPRLCRVRTGTESDETPFPLDVDGFLNSSAAIASSADSLTSGTLVAPAVAARAGTLVLLGEPGVGKTTVFGGLTDGLPDVDDASQAEHALLWLDAARLTEFSFQELLGRRLHALPEVPRPAGTTASAPRAPTFAESSHDDRDVELTIVLDQIDESPMLRWLAADLRAAMKDKNTSRLRMLLACRTADYPSALTTVLRDAVGGCVLADLAPLTRAEAVTLAASAGVDGEAVVAAAVAAGAGALASVPLTLELLVRVFHQASVLEGSPADLFAKGARLLADEHDERRRATPTVTSLDQRMAIAGRIAARLLLAGRRTVWCGSDLAVGPLDVSAGSLASGTEQTPSGPFEVTAPMVAATLGTALFTGRGEDRLAFRHSSLAAYLAVCHLREHQVPYAQLATLFLVSGDEATTSIPVPLRETAAWLVALDPSHSDWLAAADPESLAAHSVVVDSAAMRALVVGGLLDRAPQIELSDAPWRRARWQVAHPGLADQLGAVLAEVRGGEPGDWPTQARVRLAVRLAGEAATGGLAEPLLELADHDGWSSYTRRLAARSAFEAAPELAVPRLRALLLDRLADETYAAAKDPDDELRGTLLELLWPDHLALEEVLAQLRPRHDPWLFGMYARFLRTMPDRVGEADIPRLLAWAQERMEATPTATDADIERATAAEDLAPEGRQSDGEPVARDVDPDDLPIGQLDRDLLEGVIDRALAGESAPEHINAIAPLLWWRLRRFEPVALPAPLDVVDAEGVEPERARELRRALARALVALTLATGDATPGEYRHLVIGWQGRRASWRRPTPAEEAAGLRPAQRHWLLDAGDFQWALQAAVEAHAAGTLELAQALGAVASVIFDWTDAASFEAAYEQRASPVSEHLRWIWEDVRLDSQSARNLRESYLASRDVQTPPWPEAERFATLLRDRFAAAVAGDSQAFWELLWGLQFDPQTGQAPVPRFDDDIMSFPATPVLGPQPENALRDAALRYLAVEDDQAAWWLGTNGYDKRAWAGYLALAALEEAGRLDEVPGDVWASWVGALVWFPARPVGAGDADRKQRMLSLAARHAPGALAAAVARLVRGDVARGVSPLEVELIDPGWATELAEVLFGLLGEVAAALTQVLTEADSGEGQEDAPAARAAEEPSATEVDPVPEVVTVAATAEAQAAALNTWETLLRLLFSTDSDRASAVARDALGAAPDGEWQARLAVGAARMLLEVDASTFWPEIKAVIDRDPGFSRELALTCASDRADGLDLHSLDEPSLVEVYRWLADLFPPADDVMESGVHFVSREEAARLWRGTVLRQLAQRGTRAAAVELTKLAGDFPDRLDIAASVLVARGGVQANAWSPPSPEQVARLLSDARRRLVRSTTELATLLEDTLAAIGQDLPAHGELLWDRQPAPRRRAASSANAPSATTPASSEQLKDTWRPKPEAALSAYLAHEFTLRLTDRGVAVNREVLVQPRDPYGAGDRTDIAVEATLVHDPYAATPAAAPERLVVVVEVKGVWNDGLLSDQRNQLAVRYLPESNSDRGIYVVGLYPVDLWTAREDQRRAKASRLVRDDVEHALSEQADNIARELNLHTYPVVLEIPRPHPASDV